LAISNGSLLKRNFPPNSLKVVRSGSAVESFLVQDIVDSMVVNMQRKFRVRWFGFSESKDTWEPASSFGDSKMVSRYLATLKSASSSGREEC
jgi:Chromo (CHRromatin Organisation MOdifier) domain